MPTPLALPRRPPAGGFLGLGLVQPPGPAGHVAKLIPVLPLPRLLSTAVSCWGEHNGARPEGPTLGRHQPSRLGALCDPGQGPRPLRVLVSLVRNEGVRQGRVRPSPEMITANFPEYQVHASTSLPRSHPVWQGQSEINSLGHHQIPLFCPTSQSRSPHTHTQPRSPSIFSLLFPGDT